MLCAAKSRRSQDFALESTDGRILRPRHQPEQRPFQTYGQNLQLHIAPLDGPDDGANGGNGMNLAGQRGCDGNVASDLHQLGGQPLVTEKTFVLSDKQINGNNTTARVGD